MVGVGFCEDDQSITLAINYLVDAYYIGGDRSLCRPPVNRDDQVSVTLIE